MRNLGRRLEALEARPAGNDAMLAALGRLSNSDLERLEVLLLDHDQARWTQISDLAAVDQRLLNQLQEDACAN